jgi:hypothetical protein
MINDNFISFKNLGNYGRLGNQMFQVASVLSKSKDNECHAAFPNNAIIHSIFDLEYKKLDNNLNKQIKAVWNEKHFHYDQSFEHVKDFTDIIGYVQSEKYFLNNKDYILKQFKFKDEVTKYCSDSLPRGETVSIHIRRGDYLKFPDHHPLCSLQYYKNSIDFIKSQIENPVFIIFSDDLEWCKNNFPDYIFFSGTEEYDLCMMSLCKHNIIANSSFSWWGAYLNSNEKKIVCAPKLWFGPKAPQDTEDLLPENFKIMECS